jgi:hypothetical protein
MEIPNAKFQIPNNFKIQNTKSKMRGKNPPSPPFAKGGGLSEIKFAKSRTTQRENRQGY